MKRLLNRRKDKRDYRDKLYIKVVQSPPPSVDLFPNVPMILDQGEEGSCTAHGNAGCFQYIGAMEIRQGLKNEPEEYANPAFNMIFTPVSRAMIYAGERIMEGDLNSDNGAQVRDGIKFLAAHGVCSETTWPYIPQNEFVVPSAAAYTEAASHKITDYSRLVSLNDMKDCLASGFPFVFGTYLYNSFQSKETETTGIVQMPQPGEEEIGGHCFAGDTKVSLLDGSEVEIKDLIGRKEFWLYSCKENGEIVPGRGHSARITKYVNELVEVTLDNNETIKCTPDHRFMLRDGSYKEAKDLTENESLMPLYRKVNDEGYECYINNKSGKWNQPHQRVAHHVLLNDKLDCKKRIKEENKQDRFLVVHHKDTSNPNNKRNNDPSNLQWMGEHDHWMLHSSLGSESMTKLWANKEWRKERCKKNGENGRKNLLKLSKEGKCGFQNFSKEELTKIIQKGAETKRNLYPNGTNNNFKKMGSMPGVHKRLHVNKQIINPDCELCKTLNHKVKSIKNIKLEISIPVYDLTVDEHHNFALSSGIYVHNCMYCVGYDDSKQVFTVVNSWGYSWGDGGRCYIPYAYMGNPNLTDDIWTIRK